MPGYVIPMTKDEHLRALQRQIQYLLEQRHAPAMHAQWQPDRASLAESANGQAPANANGPSGGGTTFYSIEHLPRATLPPTLKL